MIEIVPSSRRLAPALVLLLAFAACDDAVSPSADFDARATADAMASMVATADDLGDAFASMEAAGSLFEDPAAAMLVTGGPLLDTESTRGYLAGPRPQAFFPANLLGVTFEYSDAEGRYVPTELEGAPADGIRILYYAVDPFTHEPQPSSPLGHVDLRDLSSAASDRLGVEVVNTAGSAPLTLAAYFVDVSWTLTETEIGALMQSEGYLSDGESQLDFDLGQSLTISESAVVVEQDFGMGLHGADLSVRYLGELMSLAGSESATLSMLVTVRNEGQTATFDVDVSEDALDGTVSAGGAVLAYIGGTPEQPQFTDPDGNPIDPAEVQALQDLFAAVSALFELAQGIFGTTQ